MRLRHWVARPAEHADRPIATAKGHHGCRHADTQAAPIGSLVWYLSLAVARELVAHPGQVRRAMRACPAPHLVVLLA